MSPLGNPVVDELAIFHSGGGGGGSCCNSLVCFMLSSIFPCVIATSVWIIQSDMFLSEIPWQLVYSWVRTVALLYADTVTLYLYILFTYPL